MKRWALYYDDILPRLTLTLYWNMDVSRADEVYGRLLPRIGQLMYLRRNEATPDVLLYSDVMEVLDKAFSYGGLRSLSVDDTGNSLALTTGEQELIRSDVDAIYRDTVCNFNAPYRGY